MQFAMKWPWSALVGAMLLMGCVDTSRTQYSVGQSMAADVSGFSSVRSYLDTPSSTIESALDWGPANTHEKIDYLMISGGGSGGAFSVGALSAWTQMGDRPTFDVVSGVSTGALIAPFAFLGPSYDPLLVRLYTSGIAKELVDRRLMPNKIIGESLLKGQQLRRMVETYVTPALIEAIAREHRNGRRLFVLTSNLDSQRAVIWNMGAIAASDSPDKTKLFQDVLVASASIPGVFPAVRIKVHAGNQTFEELHSDGGASAQVLTMPYSVQAAAKKLSGKHKQIFNMYILVNNALMPEFSTPGSGTLSVISRSYAMLIKAQTRDSLMALYGYAQRTGAGFHVASIDQQIAYTMSDPFNQNYMQAVFALAERRSREGTLWKDKPIFNGALSVSSDESLIVSHTTVLQPRD